MGKYYHISKEELTTPKNGYEVITNHWWWENDEGILAYELTEDFHPIQANSNYGVMEYMMKNNQKPYSDHVPVLIPVAYIPRREY